VRPEHRAIEVVGALGKAACTGGSTAPHGDGGVAGRGRLDDRVVDPQVLRDLAVRLVGVDLPAPLHAVREERPVPDLAPGRAVAEAPEVVPGAVGHEAAEDGLVLRSGSGVVVAGHPDVRGAAVTSAVRIEDVVAPVRPGGLVEAGDLARVGAAAVVVADLRI